MADSSNIIHQQIDEDPFCVFVLVKGLRAPKTVKH